MSVICRELLERINKKNATTVSKGYESLAHRERKANGSLTQEKIHSLIREMNMKTIL